MEEITKPLLVITDEYSSKLWKLVGASVLVFTKEAESDILKHLKENSQSYKVALVGEDVYKNGNTILKNLTDLEIPWIILLDKSDDVKIGYRELQKLSEKAVGMTLSFN